MQGRAIKRDNERRGAIWDWNRLHTRGCVPSRVSLELRVVIPAIRYRGRVKLARRDGGMAVFCIASRTVPGIEYAKPCVARLRKTRYTSRYGDVHVNVMHLPDTPPQQWCTICDDLFLSFACFPQEWTIARCTGRMRYVHASLIS